MSASGIVPLAEAAEPARFGGKSASLGAALRAGLRVPGGAALDVEAVATLAGSHGPGAPRAGGGADLLDALAIVLADRDLAGPYAVRSSAVGEDSGASSFAGQHLTRLHVRGRAALREAVAAVWASGRAPSALAYRERMGLPREARVAVAVQRMVAAEVSGVLFTRNPVSGADERVIEASWGLGEAVVAGLVTPDRWRLSRDGRVLEAALGEKDVEVVPVGEGTAERPVDAARAGRLCLGERELADLGKLAADCEAHFGGPGDIEFAFAGGALFLLQRRPITR